MTVAAVEHGDLARADALHDLLGRAAHDACEVHCRACGAVFARAGPPPYRTICPYCVGDGEIVTLTEPAGRDCAP